MKPAIAIISLFLFLTQCNLLSSNEPVDPAIQAWKRDSTIVRGILDSNEMYEIQVSKIVQKSHRTGHIWHLQLSPPLMKTSKRIFIIPAEIESLQSLLWLELSYSDLTDLPPQIFRLQNLQRLLLMQNNLNYLSDSISHLQNLKWLGLSGNSLSMLPAGIFQISGLNILSCNGNRLSTISDSIEYLQKLNTLNLSQNILISLPESITKLNIPVGDPNSESSYRFEVTNNHLCNLSPAIIAWIDKRARPNWLQSQKCVP